MKRVAQVVNDIKRVEEVRWALLSEIVSAAGWPHLANTYTCLLPPAPCSAKQPKCATRYAVTWSLELITCVMPGRVGLGSTLHLANTET